MKNFQIIILVVFVAAAIVGILVFSGTIPIGDQSQKEGSGGTVVLWGTMRSSDLAEPLENFNRDNTVFTVQYVEKRADTFDRDLLEALASGQGPDLFFISDDLAYKYSNKMMVIPYTSYSAASFKQNFANAGEVFMNSKGILAFPVSIDPLVLYYNRAFLDSSGVVYPPRYWDELPAMVPLLSKKDNTKKIERSAIALGQVSNITHAKDILAMLFMQAGNPIVSEKSGTYSSTLNQSSNLSQVLSSYTDFADPLKEVYSWNKSLPESRDAFSSEKLVFYLGFASELPALTERNPNQNFMAAEVPQIRGSIGNVTSARVTGIAISSASKNLNSAFLAANMLSLGNFAKDLNSNTGSVPARRDLLSAKPSDAYGPVFYSSALYAKAWLDPEPKDSNLVFQDMVEGVLSNKYNPDTAINQAAAKLNILLSR